MKQRFNALTLILNGPRHFLMDSITAGGATKAGKAIEAGRLQRGQVHSVKPWRLEDVLGKPLGRRG